MEDSSRFFGFHGAVSWLCPLSKRRNRFQVAREILRLALDGANANEKTPCSFLYSFILSKKPMVIFYKFFP